MLYYIPNLFMTSGLRPPGPPPPRPPQPDAAAVAAAAAQEAALKRMRATSYSAPATVHPPQASHPGAAAATAPDTSATARQEERSDQPDSPDGASKRDLPPALKAKLQARGILRLAQAASAAGQNSQQQQEPAEAVTYAASAYAVPDPDAVPPVTATSNATEGPLPPGWFSTIDTTYHRPYFYNPTTGERTWERPAPPLPSGWAEAKDPASGVTYYFNASTGKDIHTLHILTDIHTLHILSEQLSGSAFRTTIGHDAVIVSLGCDAAMARPIEVFLPLPFLPTLPPDRPATVGETRRPICFRRHLCSTIETRIHPLDCLCRRPSAIYLQTGSPGPRILHGSPTSSPGTSHGWYVTC